MRVLIDQSLPFALAHGGAQIQIERTRSALQEIGVECEFLRWWDGQQRCDLIHYFGAASSTYLHHARIAKVPVVMTQLFTETCNRPAAQLKRQGLLVKTLLAAPFGEGIKRQLAWRSYQNCDHNIVGLEAERRVLQTAFLVPPERVSVVPIGLSRAYVQANPARRNEPELICTGTITERKNFVELAQMALAARVPIRFVGKPYHPDDPYWLRFRQLIDNQWVKHSPHVDTEAEMISLLQTARGFAFMSDYENWCLSAHEAAACGLPLLVQDQNWSRERFGNQARYLPDIGMTQRNIEALKSFYADSPNLPAPKIKLHDWTEVARQLAAVYATLLKPQPDARPPKSQS